MPPSKGRHRTWCANVVKTIFGACLASSATFRSLVETLFRARCPLHLSLQKFHEQTPPSLLRVPWAGSPDSSVLWGVPTPCHPSHPASFPSPSDTACRLNIRSVFPGRRTQDRPGSDHRLFPSGFSSGNGRVSQVPGEPTVSMPCSPTPAGPEGDAVLPSDVAFRQPEAVGSRE